MINFDCTKEESALISKIVARTERLCQMRKIPFGSVIDAEMDLTACHMNGCPLDLKKLHDFDDFNLLHDMLGIAGTINRKTGKLTGIFHPRCAQTQGVTA
jgi:hypothetical protein